MSKLGGHLVGYGIETNGKVEYHWLDKPKHNMIVKSGLEHLLQFGGDPLETFGSYQDLTSINETTLNNLINENKKCNLWVGKIDEPRVHHGVLNYCAYGSGDKETEFSDTDLENRLEMTDVRFTGFGLNGNKYYPDLSNPLGIKHRISHKFNAVSDKTIIKELGWFGKAGADAETAEYVLFARIKLDEELILQPDQSLIVTYELAEELPSSVIPIGMIGNKVEASIVPVFFSNRTDNDWQQLVNFNPIDYYGNAGTPCFKNGNEFRYHSFLNWPVWYCRPKVLRTSGKYSTSTTPADSKQKRAVNWYWDSSGYWPAISDNTGDVFAERPKKYIKDSLYRISTVPTNYSPLSYGTYAGGCRGCLNNGYFYGSELLPSEVIQWMVGAIKTEYTTDVME